MRFFIEFHSIEKNFYEIFSLRSLCTKIELRDFEVVHGSENRRKKSQKIAPRSVIELKIEIQSPVDIARLCMKIFKIFRIFAKRDFRSDLAVVFR